MEWQGVTIKKSKRGPTKFKVRGSKTLYTIIVNDAEKVEKLKQSLPPGTFTINSPLKKKKT